MFRAAVGHVRPTPDAELQPAPFWALARSNAPAGSMLAMRPRDLLTFAQMHMTRGPGRRRDRGALVRGRRSSCIRPPSSCPRWA